MSIHAKQLDTLFFSSVALLLPVFLASFVGATFPALVAALVFLTGFFGVMFAAVLVSPVTARADVEGPFAAQANAFPEFYIGVRLSMVASRVQVSGLSLTSALSPIKKGAGTSAPLSGISPRPIRTHEGCHPSQPRQRGERGALS